MVHPDLLPAILTGRRGRGKRATRDSRVTPCSGRARVRRCRGTTAAHRTAAGRSLKAKGRGAAAGDGKVPRLGSDLPCAVAFRSSRSGVRGIDPVFDVPAEAPKPVPVAVAADFDPADFRFSD
jgi:hypothetical protein